MKLTEERIFELLSEYTTYDVQGPDEDDFGQVTVMNTWGHTMYARRFIDFARAIEAELEKQAPQWISVEERLPEDQQSVAFVVLCKNPNWDYIDGKVLGGVFRAEPYSGGFSVPGLTVKASHWMPLPAPPAAQGGEEGGAA